MNWTYVFSTSPFDVRKHGDSCIVFHHEARPFHLRIQIQLPTIRNIDVSSLRVMRSEREFETKDSLNFFPNMEAYRGTYEIPMRTISVSPHVMYPHGIWGPCILVEYIAPPARASRVSRFSTIVTGYEDTISWQWEGKRVEK